jgi:hypothetical protein
VRLAMSGLYLRLTAEWAQRRSALKTAGIPAERPSPIAKAVSLLPALRKEASEWHGRPCFLVVRMEDESCYTIRRQER